MAHLDIDGFDEVLEVMDSLESGEVAEDMLHAAEPVLVRNMKARAPRDTGALAASIKSTGVRSNDDGKYVTVRPTGKDAKGVRNMEKAVYREYGTAKEPSRPFIVPAVKASEGECEEKMQEAFDKYMEGMQL